MKSDELFEDLIMKYIIKPTNHSKDFKKLKAKQRFEHSEESN